VHALRQHKFEPDRKRLWYGHVRVCEPTPLITDADPPLHSVLAWIMVPNIGLAPFRTWQGLAKSDLEYDVLAGPEPISLEKLSGDRECRVRA
jgi:hypothetical protein